MSAFTDMDKEVAKALAYGLKNCLTEARSLDRVGLLLTPARKLDIASTALLDVANLIKEKPVRDLIPAGVPLTAMDIKRYIAIFIEDIVEQNKE